MSSDAPWWKGVGGTVLPGRSYPPALRELIRNCLAHPIDTARAAAVAANLLEARSRGLLGHVLGEGSHIVLSAHGAGLTRYALAPPLVMLRLTQLSPRRADGEPERK